VAPETGRGEFFKFPIRDTAGRAGMLKPLVSQPTSRPAVTRVRDRKCFPAVRGQPGQIPHDLNGSDPVQNTLPRRPELYLIDET
jgi:hypothetical protein